MNTLPVGEMASLYKESSDINCADMERHPEAGGFQGHVAVKLAPDPVVGIARQPGILFPSTKNLSLPAELVVS